MNFQNSLIICIWFCSSSNVIQKCDRDLAALRWLRTCRASICVGRHWQWPIGHGQSNMKGFPSICKKIWFMCHNGLAKYLPVPVSLTISKFLWIQKFVDLCFLNRYMCHVMIKTGHNLLKTIWNPNPHTLYCFFLFTFATGINLS